ncbi:MAG: hypothetical protein ACI4GY_08125 [Acutalibacteraceae bacterium]
MSTLKQACISIITIMFLWAAAIISLGEIGFIDTIYLWEAPEFLINIVAVIYFSAFVIIGITAKRKNWNAMLISAFLCGIIPVIFSLLVYVEDFFENLIEKPIHHILYVIINLINAFCDLFISLFYPIITIAYPFRENIFIYVLFVLAPITAVILYKVTKTKDMRPE